MIQLDNLKEILSAIGFVHESMGEFYKREYGTCVVSVDCDNKEIIYMGHKTKW